MRVASAALTICWGFAAIGAAAQQSPTSAPTTAADSKKPVQYDTGTRPKPAPGTTLRGSVVYVYSFLDTRTETVGSRGIERFHAKLLRALNGAEVQTRLLPFKDSEAAALTEGIRSESSRPIPKLFPHLRQTTQSVPVMATIARNQPNEEAAGTKYRLVLFPSYMSAMGYSASFDIDWTLTDVATGKVIWVFSTTTWYGAYAGPKLTGTIDNAMASLKKSGLIS